MMFYLIHYFQSLCIHYSPKVIVGKHFMDWVDTSWKEIYAHFSLKAETF